MFCVFAEISCLSSFSASRVEHIMHLSNKQRLMNKTFTIMTNEHCSPHHYDGDGDDEHDRHESTFEKASQLSGTSNTNRFCTFTKCKIKQQPSTVIANPYQRRYFDSPTMIVLDDDDDEIPIVRCSNRSLAAAAAAGGHEPSLNETDLSDLLVFTNREFEAQC